MLHNAKMQFQTFISEIPVTGLAASYNDCVHDSFSGFMLGFSTVM